MSTPEVSSKRAALDTLRFNKNKKPRLSPPAQQQSSSASSSTPPTSKQAYAVPTSQRDATAKSHYFPSTPTTPYTNYGTELVPNSSPINEVKYQPYGHARNQPSHPNAWTPSSRLVGGDPLGGTGGFGQPLGPPNTPKLPPLPIYMTPGSSGQRKVNPNQSPDPLNLVSSPTSPDIVRPGQKRKLKDIGDESVSSDDTLPNGVGSSKARIQRGKPADAKPPPNDALHEADENEKRFKRFAISYSWITDDDKKRAAWEQAGGDVSKATMLMEDPNFRAPPKPTPKPPPQLAPPDTGRVKELDDALHANRAAVKEKGKKSMIYAGRNALERPQSPPPTPVKKPEPVVDTSPEAPVRRRLMRKPQRRVIASDSEHEPSESEDDDEEEQVDIAKEIADSKALEFFNNNGPEALQELTGCSLEQATKIISLRPFESVDDLNTKLGQGRKKAGPSGISPRLFEDASSTFNGYSEVDRVLADCEKTGVMLRNAIAAWTPASGTNTPPADDGSLNLHTLTTNTDSEDYLTQQPSLLAEGIKLKEYQLTGVNWLHLLYREGLSCILADEMGLGKTIQVISFFALLKERGNTGPHLIVVPSSTLENWCREFSKFAPSISVQTYYASKEERSDLRQTLVDTQRCRSKNGSGWEVLITTYNLAQGDDRDRKFFRRIEWDTCVYDEGHVLKNFQSQRYQALLQYGSKWRLLLTGTPLQNNLQELVSLMNFILPEQFQTAMSALRAIFKVKGDAKVSLLAQERVSRAKKMMTPFVLRRRKDQVLRDLPKKTVRVEWCEMTELQSSIYKDALQRSRKTVSEAEPSGSNEEEGKKSTKKSRATAKTKEKRYLENSSNVLMDLRKAASHPMLFRTRFTDDILTKMTNALLKEPEFKKRGAEFQYVKEDMSVMTDSELQYFCATYKCLQRFQQDEKCFIEAGKVQRLLELLQQYFAEGRKVLIFSQFTQILDILQAVLKQKDIKYLMLTGSTPVDVRQSLVDEFTEDPSTSVFLLSTKAGGLGITLTAASVVIMFDLDYNPHNDRQAQDRAYRIGQTRDVEVVKLLSRHTIEEDMLRLGETKLALDDAVAGDVEDDNGESAPEKEMKTSLMASLRRQLEEGSNAPTPPS